MRLYELEAVLSQYESLLAVDPVHLFSMLLQCRVLNDLDVGTIQGCGGRPQQMRTLLQLLLNPHRRSQYQPYRALLAALQDNYAYISTAIKETCSELASQFTLDAEQERLAILQRFRPVEQNPYQPTCVLSFPESRHEDGLLMVHSDCAASPASWASNVLGVPVVGAKRKRSCQENGDLDPNLPIRFVSRYVEQEKGNEFKELGFLFGSQNSVASVQQKHTKQYDTKCGWHPKYIVNFDPSDLELLNYDPTEHHGLFERSIKCRRYGDDDELLTKNPGYLPQGHKKLERFLEEVEKHLSDLAEKYEWKEFRRFSRQLGSLCGHIPIVRLTLEAFYAHRDFYTGNPAGALRRCESILSSGDATVKLWVVTHNMKAFIHMSMEDILAAETSISEGRQVADRLRPCSHKARLVMCYAMLNAKLKQKNPTVTAYQTMAFKTQTIDSFRESIRLYNNSERQPAGVRIALIRLAQFIGQCNMVNGQLSTRPLDSNDRMLVHNALRHVEDTLWVDVPHVVKLNFYLAKIDYHINIESFDEANEFCKEAESLVQYNDLDAVTEAQELPLRRKLLDTVVNRCSLQDTSDHLFQLARELAEADEMPDAAQQAVYPSQEHGSQQPVLNQLGMGEAQVCLVPEATTRNATPTGMAVEYPSESLASYNAMSLSLQTRRTPTEPSSSEINNTPSAPDHILDELKEIL